MKKENIIKIVKCLFIVYCIVLIYLLFLYGFRGGNQFDIKIFSKEHFEMPNIFHLRRL